MLDCRARGLSNTAMTGEVHIGAMYWSAETATRVAHDVAAEPGYAWAVHFGVARADLHAGTGHGAVSRPDPLGRPRTRSRGDARRQHRHFGAQHARRIRAVYLVGNLDGGLHGRENRRRRLSAPAGCDGAAAWIGVGSSRRAEREAAAPRSVLDGARHQSF